MAVVFNPFTKKLDFTGSGTSGGGNTTQFKALRAVTPVPDGTNTVFTIADSYTAGTVTPYLNGLAESNFTESGSNQITFSTPPFVGEQLLVSYEITTASAVVAAGTYGGLYGTATYS